MNEDQKGKIEQEIFSIFSVKANIPIKPGSIKKEFPPYPDISCTVIGGGKIWFELAEACAPEFKQAENEIGKLIRKLEVANAPSPTPPVVWGGDVSVQTVQKKIRKQYPVEETVELLLYTNGMSAMTDGILKAHLVPILVDGAGAFHKVWLMGDDVQQIWPRISK